MYNSSHCSILIYHRTNQQVFNRARPSKVIDFGSKIAIILAFIYKLGLFSLKYLTRNSHVAGECEHVFFTVSVQFYQFFESFFAVKLDEVQLVAVGLPQKDRGFPEGKEFRQALVQLVEQHRVIGFSENWPDLDQDL